MATRLLVQWNFVRTGPGMNEGLPLSQLCGVPTVCSGNHHRKAEVEVTLRLTLGQSVCLGVEPTVGRGRSKLLYH
jgi:hypothetical protein